MGNAVLRCIKQCSNGDDSIRVMKVDGQILRFECPMYADEILCNYPNDALFHSESLHRFGGQSRPLASHTPLKEGELYYLLPRPPTLPSNNNNNNSETTHYRKCLRRSLSLREKKPSIEIIPSPSQDGVVRLKLLISKRELATLMSESTDAMAMVESIVTPLLTQMEAHHHPKSKSSSLSSRGGSFSWKPELESIPEINVTLSSH